VSFYVCAYVWNQTFHMIEAVAERLEGAPQQVRRHWSDEFKAGVVAEACVPGASVSAIARRVGIHPSQLFGWRRALAGHREQPLEPAAPPEQVAMTSDAVVEIIIDGVIVRAGADVSEAHLSRVIRAVRLA
jgi:transposase